MQGVWSPGPARDGGRRRLCRAAARERRVRRGLTIPEVAVLLAVLICCLAVAAPYLLKLRETARQEQCRRNLKELSAAVLGWEQGSKRFPAGQEARRFRNHAIGRYADPAEPRATDGQPASGASWVVPCLPFLNQKELFDQWNRRGSVAANRRLAETELAVLYCPSRRGGGLCTACDRVGEDWTRGGNDYAACSGSGITFHDEARQTWALEEMQLAATMRGDLSPYSQAPRQRGIFGVNSRVTRADVEMGDGLAYVLLAAERRVFRGSAPGPHWSSDGWAWGGPATLFSTRFAPHTGSHYDEADSEHPGLVNVALADGRVRPVHWNIDLRTWNNLGNYAQGSPLQHPEFR